MSSLSKKNLFFFMISVAFMISKGQADYGGLKPAGGAGPRINGCYTKALCDAKGSGNVLLGDTTNCYNSGGGSVYGCGTSTGCVNVNDPSLSGCSSSSVHDCVNVCSDTNGKCCISKVWTD